MIVTSAQFQQFLTLEGSTMSMLDIDMLIPIAEDVIGAYCGRNFARHTANEVFEIFDAYMYQIRTKNYPVIRGTVLLSNNTELYVDEDLTIA